MEIVDCASFDALLDRRLGELRLDLSRKHRLDMQDVVKSTVKGTQGVDFEAPLRTLPDIRTEIVHSMLSPSDMPPTLDVENDDENTSQTTAQSNQPARLRPSNSMTMRSLRQISVRTSLRKASSKRGPSRKIVRDSLEDEECNSRRGSGRNSYKLRRSRAQAFRDLSVFTQPSRPDATSRVVWDVLMCAVMVMLILAEAATSAIPEFQDTAMASAWSLFLFVVFTFDILINFNTALVWVVGRKVVVIDDRWRIAKAYFKRWFIIDTLSTFPFDMVLSNMVSASNSRMFKLGKILRMPRLVKGMVKISKLMEHWGEIQDRIQEKILDLVGCQGHHLDKLSKYVSRATLLFVCLLVEAHLFACCLLVWSRKVQSMSWRNAGVDIQDLEPFNRYVTAFRDVMYVLTTGLVNEELGFGDILPTVLVVWFYVQLHVVIAFFTGIKADPSLFDSDFNLKRSKLRRYLRHHNVIKRVRDEVDTHMSKVGKYAGMHLDTLLDELPSSIRQSVSAGLYYPFYVHMAFFVQSGASESFEYDICASIESIFYRPHDRIVSKGSTLHGLHYLSEGYASITQTLPSRMAASPSKREDETDWKPRDYLFLEGLFALEPFCVAMRDVEAIEPCEVWFLARATFDKLLQATDQLFRSRMELLRTKVIFCEERYSWVMEVADQDNCIHYIGLEYLVEDGRFPHPLSDAVGMMETFVGLESQSFGQDLLPPGKRFHYFLSHRKRHSKLGNRPELVAQSLHDALDAKGLIGFFDVDNLVEISQQSLEQAVRESCTMIIILNDETAESQWCRFEWDCAAKCGIPMKCVVDAQHCSKAEILDTIGDVNTALLQYQWSEYLDRYRKAVTKDLVAWIRETPIQVQLSSSLGIGQEVDLGCDAVRIQEEESLTQAPLARSSFSKELSKQIRWVSEEHETELGQDALLMQAEEAIIGSRSISMDWARSTSVKKVRIASKDEDGIVGSLSKDRVTSKGSTQLRWSDIPSETADLGRDVLQTQAGDAHTGPLAMGVLTQPTAKKHARPKKLSCMKVNTSMHKLIANELAKPDCQS